MIFFSERHKLGKLFEEWAKENNALNCPETTITWLYGLDLLMIFGIRLHSMIM